MFVDMFIDSPSRMKDENPSILDECPPRASEPGVGRGAALHLCFAHGRRVSAESCADPEEGFCAWHGRGRSCNFCHGRDRSNAKCPSCRSEGIHAAKVGTRFEALEPIRQGVKARFGAYGRGVAKGLSIRHDSGSQDTSDAFQVELRFLGAESSPSFVRSPEGNGCAERFIRTLKARLLWGRTFATVEQLRRALLQRAPGYNEHWLLECHNFLSPSQARRELLQKQAP